MTKAMELLNEINGASNDKLFNNIGRTKDILAILNIIEHEILEVDNPYHNIISDKYNKLLYLIRKEAFKEIPPLVDLAVKHEKGYIFYITEIFDNKYLINDMYEILSLLNRTDIVSIFTCKNNVEESYEIEKINTDVEESRGEVI